MSKTCNNCHTQNSKIIVPYVAYESAMVRAERHIKRLWIIILILIGSLIGTNLAWTIYESQFETVEIISEECYDVEQNAENGNNNSIINGEKING